MKENKYDDPRFFAAYSQFPRSVYGLSAAGEWPVLQKMLPDFAGKRVLDVGCGFGWHCAYAAEHGAKYVLGVDLSEQMLTIARERRSAPNVEFRRVAMEDMTFEPDSFDVALSSLAFHYTPDFPDICRRVHRCLVSGGDFVFSVEHPIFTADGPQDWVYNEAGERVCWPVDRYFSEGAREAVFAGEKIVKYHRTLTTYLNGLMQTGFAIRSVVEPQPSDELLESAPKMRDELRRPMMLLIAANKR